MNFKKIFDAKNATREEWLSIRRKGIGGSDMAAVLGVSKYGNALTVWEDKRGEREPVEENEFMYWGNVLEEVVAQEFSKRTGWKVRNNNYTLQSIEYPYLLANIDRDIVGVDAGLECKTASAYKESEWEGDKVPDNYYVQCQHYMAVTGKASWWIACLVGGNRFFYKEIPRDEDLIKTIIEEGKAFWQMVIDGTKPAVDGSDESSNALKRWYPAANDRTIELGESAKYYISEYQKAKEEEAAATARKKEAQNVLCSMLGENQSGTIGEYTVNWKNRKGSETLDKKAFKAEYPELFDKFVKVGQPTRMFSIK